MDLKLTAKIHLDLPPKKLIQMALDRQEGVIAANGALTVATGDRTGRSPKDRFIVKDDITANTIDWGNINQPIDIEKFNALWQRALEHINQHEAFVSHYHVGANEKHSIPVKVVTELAWHNLFCHTMFIRRGKPNDPNQWTILNVPSLETVPFQDGVNSNATLIINFSTRQVLLCGLRYAGEMKKAMFSVLNFMLTDKKILPMHCAANAGKNGDVTLFFGLSGTGKTTLSADPDRFLIGDDEHGWSKDGVFNFEGGCYAKCINLTEEREPVIWHALREGTIMENVVLDKKTLEPDFSDASLAQNSRAAYPLDHIEKRVASSTGAEPKNVLFLTCDLFGVLPPVSKLSKEQAAYYFLSGYTALVGSTEVGQGSGVKPTFSTCFGAPFFPRPAHIYAELLMQRIEESGCHVYLVNTGWTGGAYQQGGTRFPIPVTRKIVTDIISGELEKAECHTFPGFNLSIPKTIPGIDDKLLNPEIAWKDKKAFEKNRDELIHLFKENFKKFTVSDEILKAGVE